MADDNTPTIGGAELAAMDAKPAVAVSEPPAGSEEATLAEMAARDPGSYRYGENGKHAARHLQLRNARLGDGEEGADADDDSEADEAATDYSTDAAEEAPAAKGKEAADEAEPLETLEVNLEVPDSAEDYITATADDHWSRQNPAAEKYAEFLHEQGMPRAAFDAGIAYVEKMRADLQAKDKEERAAARARLSSEDRVAITATLNDLGTFGKLLQTARGPDGSLLITRDEFSSAMLSLASRRGSTPAPVASGDQARLVELQKIMNADVGRMNERTGRRNADGSWETLSDEMLSIRRRVDAQRKRA